MNALLGALLFLETLQPGTLPRQWRPSGPQCTEVPDWQVHEYNANLFIIRESGCTNYEKPFLYLIFGENKALLQDTGAGVTDIDRLIPRLLSQWAKRANKPVPPLLVVHSHSHGDHTAGDKQLAALPNVTVVPAKPAEIETALQMPGWPETPGVIDLGNRVIDAIAIPGHDTADLALYDRQTGLLFTGDTLYPGRLYVRNFPEYVKSVDRLAAFTATRPVSHILGTHIEQARTPFTDYKVRTVYQPDEAVLELSRGDLLELQAALAAMQGKPRRQELSRFTISPRMTLPGAQ
ncbi:MAG TPA: MBL fold metallo-hydrolase [Bryobacteraceae bacterium]|nr:MBL fold metallo-hydrolase [Bryobacteraceae bacterium]